MDKKIRYLGCLLLSGYYFLLAGCGQSGALYLPDKINQQKTYAETGKNHENTFYKNAGSRE
jgi:predicted small lipoprotein YifL